MYGSLSFRRQDKRCGFFLVFLSHNHRILNCCCNAQNVGFDRLHSKDYLRDLPPIILKVQFNSLIKKPTILFESYPSPYVPYIKKKKTIQEHHLRQPFLARLLWISLQLSKPSTEGKASKCAARSFSGLFLYSEVVATKETKAS